MRTLVVTAANEAFVPLLRGLVASLQQWSPSPYTDFACFDLGFAAGSRRWLEGVATYLVEPGWDLPVSESLRLTQPYLRALTVRPFLPRYFPGYDIYLWIDADAWVQERFALDWLLAAAATGRLAVVPQTHHAYLQTEANYQWRMRRMVSCFGPDAGLRVAWHTYFNAGVFALRADAPHWSAWSQWFQRGIEASLGEVCCDQTALNQAIWMERLAVTPLPPLCNWMCHLALPRFDLSRKRFFEPAAPGHALGILHLSANSKDAYVEARGEGRIQNVGLRFPGHEQVALTEAMS